MLYHIETHHIRTVKRNRTLKEIKIFQNFNGQVIKYTINQKMHSKNKNISTRSSWPVTLLSCIYHLSRASLLFGELWVDWRRQLSLHHGQQRRSLSHLPSEATLWSKEYRKEKSKLVLYTQVTVPDSSVSRNMVFGFTKGFFRPLVLLKKAL